MKTARIKKCAKCGERDVNVKAIFLCTKCKDEFVAILGKLGRSVANK